MGRTATPGAAHLVRPPVYLVEGDIQMTTQEKAAGVFAPPTTATQEQSPASVSTAKIIGKPASLLSVASEINIAHAHAIQHADKAIGLARQVGDLLLKAKADLPHGEFLPWVESHCTVSPRQAQRYMAASLGKPMPLRAIKSEAIKYDTVSHLEVKTGEAIYINRKFGNWLDRAFIWPDSLHPGYFHFAFISGQDGQGAQCTYTKRSTSARGIAFAVRIEFPDWRKAEIERCAHPGYVGNPFAGDDVVLSLKARLNDGDKPTAGGDHAV